MKEFIVHDYGNGMVEEFDTEEEAVIFANESLHIYREEAKADGEWHDEAEGISVYRLTHFAAPINISEEHMDYEIRKYEDSPPLG